MSLSQRIARQTLIQFIGRLASLFLGMWAIFLMTRYLGPAQFGYYVIATAFMQIAGILVDFGFYNLVLQIPSGDSEKETKIFNNIFTIRFFSAILFYGLAIFIGFLFPYPLIVKLAIAISAIAFWANTMIQIFTAYFQRLAQTRWVAVAEIVNRFLLVAGLFYIIKNNLGFYALMWLLSLVALINLLILLSVVALRRKEKIKLFFDAPIWKDILSQAWPIGLAIALNLIYFKADTLILAIYRPPEEVGFYGASYRVLEILMTFPLMFIGLVIPFLSKSWLEGNRENFKRYLQKAFDFLVLAAVPLALGAYVLSDRLMIFVAGPEFSVSGRILKIIIFATSIIFVSQLFTHTLFAIRRQKTMLWFYFLIAVVSLAAYFIFIPRYSYWAAAVITLISELSIFIASYLIVVRVVKIKLNWRVFYLSLIASLFMILIIYLLSGLNLFFLIILGILVYVSGIYFLGAINKKVIYDLLKP
ncbi:MAG: flippase [Patescibacteria group bacterium]